MTPNDDLTRWGESPADAYELTLAGQLGESDGPLHDRRLAEVEAWLAETVQTVLTWTGLFDSPPPAGEPVRLALCVSRAQGPVALTRPEPTALRDLRRVPDDASKAVLFTGERVRVEAVCDRAGYLTVFNIGPSGTLNLLHPDDPARARPSAAGERLCVADVELTPPAGRERLYAVWSKAPLAPVQLARLARSGNTTRDLKRVQATLDQLPPDDWHAVLLELEHRA